MSSLPAELDFTANPAATPARMDEAMGYIVSALRRAESARPDFEAAIERLRAIGLERLDAVLSPIFIDAQDIAQQLATIRGAWLTGAPLTQLLADLTTQVTGRLAASDQRLVDNAAAVATALAGLTIGRTVQAYSANLDALALVAAEDYGRSLLAVNSTRGMFTKLGLPSSATFAQATAAEYRAATLNRALCAEMVWAAAQTVDLVDAPTIAVDCSTFLNAKITLGGNRILGAPGGGKPHQSGTIEIYQDGTGSRALGFHSSWGLGPTVPSLSTAPGTRDVLRFEVLSDGRFDSYLSKAR